MTGRSISAVLALSCLVGCKVGPVYHRPAAPVPEALKELKNNDQWKMATPADDLPKGKWWEVFGDPKLNQLEELVSANNRNIRVAEAQFRQARALITINRSGYYPTIGSTPAATQTDIGKNARGGGSQSQTFSTPATATWEPDFWGRVRLSVQNAVAVSQQSAALIENVRLSQQALLATAYFALAAQDMQSAVLANTIEAYDKNLQLTMNRYKGGVASRSDITLATTQLAAAKAQATDVRIARAQNEHAIAILTGQLPGSFEIGPTKIESAPPPIPIGIPSQLLERRPDIAASERNLAALNANIGIAQTAYYPTLILTANAGLFATNLANLLTYASRSWTGGASISQTLFDYGRRGAQLEAARAAYDAASASYEQTVLAAFQEVEDDLASLRYLAEEATQQAEAVVAAREALSLEMDRYKAGTDSYLNVITTQTIALTDEQNAITILQRRMTAAVDLVKAVGGGWDPSGLPTEYNLRARPIASAKGSKSIAKNADK